MDKYAVEDKDLREDLINEEHTLMIQLSDHITNHNKTAQEDAQTHRIQSRLNAVRDKILTMDIKK